MDLSQPLLLLLLPLVLLPWLRSRVESLDFSYSEWLPEDSTGLWLERGWRLLASLSFAALIVGLAGPGRSEQQIQRVGRGAEISILLDRSASMDTRIRRKLPEPWEAPRASQTKNEVVRAALLDLLEQRPDNRYALNLFNIVALRVTPFSDDVDMVIAGLQASGIGRGPSETNMGLALLTAIETFEDRDYSGSRSIVLVSDGGARLAQPIQDLIRKGLQKHKISLYFIYIQSSPNSPDLEKIGMHSESTIEEVELHVFFQGLGVEYQVFQANDPESMAEAVKQIDTQQNSPLTYFEQLPRVDHSRIFYIIAFASCLLLSGLGLWRMERWT